ncbi:MAG TPA: ATP-dependent helicase HrpB [Bryobacteraceae bacterium]
MAATHLPIDDLLLQIVDTLRRTRDLIIEAAPGAGKTTRVPPALLQLDGEVWVLEPRRIAARMAARRVAEELGERPGETVGYQVRFEEIAGPKTRIRFLTEGVFTRRLFSNPTLRNVGAVILDEFHERHLDTDLALALLRRLQKSRRPDLRLGIMSATLDTAAIARFLGDCPILRSEGRLHHLSISYTPYSPAPLEQQVAAAFERLGPCGDILTFLPGAAEIRRAASSCAPLAQRLGYLITPLYGDLSPAEQDRAVTPGKHPKLILSTNIAESSITIDGVRAVIDSGLARIAGDSPWTGIPSLKVDRVSQSSALQRAGRAGRTGPGQVVRLYTAEDFHRRPDHDAPEITRRELSQFCLQLEAMGIHDPRDLEWLDPPPDTAIDAAASLLDLLRARGDQAAQLARFPLHPRLARLLLAEPSACAVAALVSSGQQTPSTDLHLAIEEEWTPATRSIYDQLRRLVKPSRTSSDPDALSRAALQAFPDRVARRGAKGQVLLSNGASATITAAPSEFFVAIDIEDRSDRPLPLIRLACEIQPDWLLDLFPERVTARSGVEWNRQAERVEAVSALDYDKLVIDENRGGTPDPEAAARLLTEKAFEAGIERFIDPAELEEFLARVDFAAQHSSLPPLTDTQVRAAFAELCYGLRSFAQLKDVAASFLSALERRTDAALLHTVAPARLRLPGGRQTKIHYDRGKPPWIASRLQDFFGMTETPRIARGKVPVVVQLLAPSNRPVQTTTDLAGFWQRLYPQLRKELGRRYPKHKWPENPTAV